MSEIMFSPGEIAIDDYTVVSPRMPSRTHDGLKCNDCHHRLQRHFPRGNLTCCRDCEKTGGICDLNPTNHTGRWQYEGVIVNCARQHTMKLEKVDAGERYMYRCNRKVQNYRCTKIYIGDKPSVTRYEPAA